MENLFSIKNKIVLITGSSQGLGWIMAKALAEAGAQVIINGRNEQKLSKASQKLKEFGLQVDGFSFDITNTAEINTAVDQIAEKYGSIDILVNNAGIQIRSPLEQFADQDWQDIMNTNLSGAFKVSRAVVPQMISRKEGKIINICSLQSELGRSTIAPYAAAKGGLKMLTKAMATEWAQHNIQVNGIGPGYFITDMTKSLAENQEFDQWLKHRTPAQRWGKPEELIGTLIFLASAASSFVNGQIIFVDGGILAAI